MSGPEEDLVQGGRFLMQQERFIKLHAVWSIRVLNIRASTQIWEENKGNLRVFPVLRLISQEYSQYSISDTKGNVIIHVEVHLSGFIEYQTWAFRKVFRTGNGCIGSQKW